MAFGYWTGAPIFLISAHTPARPLTCARCGADDRPEGDDGAGGLPPAGAEPPGRDPVELIRRIGDNCYVFDSNRLLKNHEASLIVRLAAAGARKGRWGI